MKLPKFLRRSIGLTQAITVLLASLLISLVLSTLQLAYTFLEQQRAAIELRDEILTLAEGGATTASWTLDTDLANEVIHSVIALGDVQNATLVDEDGAVLASASRELRDYDALTSVFVELLIRDPIAGQRQLRVSTDSGLKVVGVFSIVLAPEHIAARFIAVAKPVFFVGLAQALCIGLVLLWLSARLVTAPLRRAAKTIEALDPANPAGTVIPISPGHEHNELGHLLAHTNNMVCRLSSVQHQFRILATHDPLTKLPNRSCLIDRLEQMLARATRLGTRCAVLFLDLDDFKTVNDSHGHVYGDELLLQVSTRLQEVLRSNDTVGRLGGDEFLVVVEDITTPEDVVPTVRRVRTALEEPFAIGAFEARLNCSIGVAVFPEDGADASELISHSDLAMYQAKKEPGSQFRFFTDEMRQRMQSRVQLETALRQALEQGEFRLAYQPKLGANGQLLGCEALIRWQQQGRLVSAIEFIEVAEQTGIIVDIGYQVLEKACAQARDWSLRHGPISVAINVSAQQLRAVGFVGRVFEAARRYKIDPGMIELEITETDLIKDLDNVVLKLNRLREKGFVISIDDFGTGYSSLTYLTQLPADSLKIDRSFVSGPHSSEVLLKTIIAMAQALNLTTVAEGIETKEQHEQLIAMGCDVLQGYLLGRPMPATEFEAQFLRSAA